MFYHNGLLILPFCLLSLIMKSAIFFFAFSSKDKKLIVDINLKMSELLYFKFMHSLICGAKDGQFIQLILIGRFCPLMRREESINSIDVQ